MAIDKFRGITGLCKRLHTDSEKGIHPDSIPSREEHYGSNKPLVKESTTFFEFVWECFEDLTLKILIGAALISLVVGMIESPADGWLEGVAILLAIVIVVMVTSVNNYTKEQKFRKLNEEAQEREITVIRDGSECTISVFDLQVGDVARTGAGDVMPVDALVLWSMNMQVDESSVTGESKLINKGLGEGENPFLLSGSQIADGTGVILVLTVGARTFLGRNLEIIQNVEETETPLQEKLNYIAEFIGKIGFAMALLTFAVLIIYEVIDIISNGWGDESGSKIVDAFIIAVTIVVVAVPEGLPLAVTLSLAFSVNQMKKKNNLVRHLDASETMGQATNICSDKTGTLTQNIMKVVAMYAQDELVEKVENEALHPRVKDILGEHFCHNTTASVSNDENGKEKFTGSRTEIALLKLGKKWGYNYEKKRNLKNIIHQIPFNSKLKRMETLVRVEGKVYFFVKGASETVVEMCKTYIDKNGEVHRIHKAHRRRIGSVISGFAHRAYRTLALAYKEYDSNDTSFMDEGKANMDLLESNLVLLGIFGIEDPIRHGVPHAVDVCKGAGITVRMVTGDNKDTAVAIARSCGILDRNYRYKEGDDTVMIGEEFRNRVEGLIDADVGESKDKVVKNLEEFKKIVRKLRVLARSSPLDKFILVTGLRQLNEVVAVTGDGSNDAPALKKSNVGFAMHLAGTQLAQEASDIILLDDNFASIVTAILWGRNIYDSISKFIQFQLTVNVVALAMSFVGAAVVKVSPLTAVQMLWVNLIMDTFAALALATEPPERSLLQRHPVKHDDSLLTVHMVKTIIGQSIYQIIWLTFILFFLPDVSMEVAGEVITSQVFNPGMSTCCSSFTNDPNTVLTECGFLTDTTASATADLSCCNSVEAWYDTTGDDTPYACMWPPVKENGDLDLTHFTLFFQVFVIMQVFNQINCRKLKSTELNVFKGFFNNPLFLGIMLATVIVQYLLVQFGGRAVNCSGLSVNLHVFCLAIGAGGLLFGILFRMVPTRLFACFNLTEGSMAVAGTHGGLTTMIRKKTTRSMGMLAKK